MIIYLIMMILFIYLINKHFNYESYSNHKLNKDVNKNIFIKPLILKHSEDPNTIVVRHNGSFYLQTTRKLKKGEDLTYKHEHDLKYQNVDYFEIKQSKIHGFGYFAKKYIPINTKLFTGIVDKKVTFFGKYINHNKICNTKLIKVDNRYDVVSSKNINIGDEITIDYDTTPPFINNSDPLWNK